MSDSQTSVLTEAQHLWYKQAIAKTSNWHNNRASQGKQVSWGTVAQTAVPSKPSFKSSAGMVLATKPTAFSYDPKAARAPASVAPHTVTQNKTQSKPAAGTISATKQTGNISTRAADPKSNVAGRNPIHTANTNNTYIRVMASVAESTQRWYNDYAGYTFRDIPIEIESSAESLDSDELTPTATCLSSTHQWLTDYAKYTVHDIPAEIESSVESLDSDESTPTQTLSDDANMAEHHSQPSVASTTDIALDVISVAENKVSSSSPAFENAVTATCLASTQRWYIDYAGNTINDIPIESESSEESLHNYETTPTESLGPNSSSSDVKRSPDVSLDQGFDSEVADAMGFTACTDTKANSIGVEHEDTPEPPKSNASPATSINPPPKTSMGRLQSAPTKALPVAPRATPPAPSNATNGGGIQTGVKNNGEGQTLQAKASAWSSTWFAGQRQGGSRPQPRQPVSRPPQVKQQQRGPSTQVGGQRRTPAAGNAGRRVAGPGVVGPQPQQQKAPAAPMAGGQAKKMGSGLTSRYQAERFDPNHQAWLKSWALRGKFRGQVYGI
ncbi:hypothetical protein K490DRAFT_53404 [Saccharata proteae CBS 121410]|uniref:Uncharacterized protein n=1 Tax=Saccharata proteae CBS 121410 TaxID=1314787 RepID=A0A9P4HZQ3_9PEZI|nr:hypothetical protein K490DRAFT_53404 [Saccharata proteae CBS 121410]